MALDENTTRLAEQLDLFIGSKLTSLFDAKRDVLFIFRIGEDERRPAIGVDVGGDFWIMQDPETGEIDNIEIEDFERVFLPRHPEFRDAWLQAKVAKDEDNVPNRAFISKIVALVGAGHSAAA